jgi:hypothetical protein
VLGYVRLEEGAGNGAAAIRPHAYAIDHACAERGLRPIGLVCESGRGGPPGSPALSYALEQIARDEVDGLVVARLEHLGTSVSGLLRLIKWFSNQDARLVAADVELDIQSTDAAEAEGPQNRHTAAADDLQLKQLISAMRAQGMTLQAIADTLNAEGVPTLRGGARWWRSTVHAAAGYKRPRERRPRDTLSGSDPPGDAAETAGIDERGSHG